MDIRRVASIISSGVIIASSSVPISFAMFSSAHAEIVNECVSWDGTWLTNVCNYDIELTWCTEAQDKIPSCPGLSSDNLSPGRKAYVGVRGRVFWGACRGKYTMGSSTFDGSKIRLSCHNN